MLGTSTAVVLITDSIGDVGTAMLAILGVFLGVAIGYLIFKFGWRRTKQAVK